MDLNAINEAVRPPRETLVDETLHFLGAAYMVSDITVRPPTAGVVALMDIVKLAWITGESPSHDDARAALLLMDMRDDAVGLVMDACYSTEPKKHLAGLAPYTDITEEELSVLSASITTSMSIAATGFNFFPRTGEAKEDMSFGAEFLAAVCRVYGELGLPPEKALWDEPLTRVGFVMAAVAKSNGMKNIGRENTLDWDKAWHLINMQQ